MSPRPGSDKICVFEQSGSSRPKTFTLYKPDERSKTQAMKAKILLFIWSLCVVSFAQDADENWLTVKNNKDVELDIQVTELTEEEATFRVRNKTAPYTLPLDKFSKDSQAKIKRWFADRKARLKEEAERKSKPYNVEVLSETATSSAYQTRHFKITCDAKLAKAIVDSFAPQLEGAYSAVADLPLGITPTTTGDRFQFELIAEESQFRILAQSLSKKSVGIYRPDEKKLFASLARMGVIKRGDVYKTPAERTNRPLLHDASLLLLQDYFEQYPPWLLKGIADYVAAGTYAKKTLAFDNQTENLKSLIAKHHGISQDPVPVTHPKDLLKLPPSGWGLGSPRDVDQRTYSSALILHYFTDLAGDPSVLQKYSDALREGKNLETAMKELLGGKDLNTTANAMLAAWKKNGLVVKFD